jgi:hypothetical protein
MGEPDISGELAFRRSRIVYRPAAPAAGADWSAVVPAGHTWRIIAIGATLVTSAAVATRVVHMAFNDGHGTYIRVPAQASQAASLTRYYAWFPESGGDATGSGISTPLPDGGLMAGWSVGTITELIDVADQWSNIALLLRDTTVKGGDINIDEIPELIVQLA